jgi:hypothetical protein
MSPNETGVAVIVGALALIGATFFGAHVLAPFDPALAPAASASAVIPKSSPALPSATTLLAPDDFDAAKKYRQINWCERHHGVPDMTFTRDKSNVLCLRPEAIIPLPAGELE